MSELQVWRKINELERVLERLKTQEKGDRWMYLTTPLTSTTWDGDAKSTAAAATLDLSSVFTGVPAGIKAALVRLEARDSATWGTAGNYLAVGPDTTYFYAMVCHAAGGDVKNSITGVVPCDANGDIAVRIIASGAGTLDAWIEIWGYCL